MTSILEDDEVMSPASTQEDDQSQVGYLYCMSNPVYDGIYKIGFTEKDPEKRRLQLSSTSVPLDFKIEFAKKVLNFKSKEKLIHSILSGFNTRINPKREFFKVELEIVHDIFKLIEGDWYQS